MWALHSNAHSLSGTLDQLTQGLGGFLACRCTHEPHYLDEGSHVILCTEEGVSTREDAEEYHAHGPQVDSCSTRHRERGGEGQPETANTPFHEMYHILLLPSNHMRAFYCMHQEPFKFTFVQPLSQIQRFTFRISYIHTHIRT